MKSGTVKEYDRDRGFGFVTADDGEDYFFNISNKFVEISPCLDLER